MQAGGSIKTKCNAMEKEVAGGCSANHFCCCALKDGVCHYLCVTSWFCLSLHFFRWLQRKKSYSSFVGVNIFKAFSHLSYIHCDHFAVCEAKQGCSSGRGTCRTNCKAHESETSDKCGADCKCCATNLNGKLSFGIYINKMKCVFSVCLYVCTSGNCSETCR